MFKSKIIAVLLIIPLLLTLIWFRNGLVVGGGEDGLIFYNPSIAFEYSKSLWTEYGIGFSVLWFLQRLPLLFVASLFTEQLGLQSYVVQAGLFFILLATGIISMYYLTLLLLGGNNMKRSVAFIASLFYLLNPYSMSQVWSRGLYPQFFYFALLPLLLLLLILGLEKKKYRYALLITFASVIYSPAFGFVTFIFTFWVLVIASLLYWLYFNKKNKKDILFVLSFFFILLSSWVLVHAWWFFPVIFSNSVILSGYLTNSQENLGTLLGVSRNFTPHVIIRLLQRTYFFDPSAYSTIYSSVSFQLISIIPVVFMILGLTKVIKSPKLRKFKFFILLFVLGLIVSLGANPPFGSLFVFAFKKISFLQAFRNPYEKFGLVYTLGYSGLFAYGLIAILNKKRLSTLLISFVFFLVCGVYAWPMWTGRVVAAPDKKIGLAVPGYYNDLKKWLDTSNENFRVFMTPLWAGDGATYRWEGGGKYQGLDPMMFFVNQPVIGSSAQVPFHYDFMQNIRKHMQQMDVTPVLSLLRAKYVVNREDAIEISESERNHAKFITSIIYPPTGINESQKILCSNRTVNQEGTNPAWILCELAGDNQDISNAKYLHLVAKVDVPANLDLAIRDTKQMRPRWYGRGENEYFLSPNEWETVLIPLGAPTEVNNNTDFSKIELIELQAHPIDAPGSSVGKIELKGIWLDPGKEVKLSNFKPSEKFGKLTVYEPKDFIAPPEFGTMEAFEVVGTYEELFKSANIKKDSLDRVGFIISSQNKDKDSNILQEESGNKINDLAKISSTRYWVQLDEQTAGYLLLSRTYNSGWKVLPGVRKEEVMGRFSNDIALLRKVYIPEENHFVGNGYANVWRVDGEGEYAVIFLPQIVADIGTKISVAGVVLLFFPIAAVSFKFYERRNKTRKNP